MRIFINDVPVRIIKLKNFEEGQIFELEIDAGNNHVANAQFYGNVLIKNVSLEKLEEVIELIANNPFAKLNSITILASFNIRIRDFIKSYYTIVKAAGGIVEKGKKILMIHRLRKWDFPKGKVEKGESYVEAAVREVEEECNINVKPGEEICTSFHTYTLGGKNILKRTVWFAMKCIDDKSMKPSKEENIDEIRWMNHKELLHSLHDTYRSLGYVMEAYFRKRGQID